MAKKIESKSLTYPGYLHLPHKMTEHRDFISLSGSALRLLIDIARQYNGYNNGDFCCSMSVMKERGWNSNSLLQKAKEELLSKDWIVMSRQGGFNIRCSLYAITWQPIHECKGKHDLSPTDRPSRSLR
jgi:hypothetical protein